VCLSKSGVSSCSLFRRETVQVRLVADVGWGCRGLGACRVLDRWRRLCGWVDLDAAIHDTLAEDPDVVVTWNTPA